MIGRLSPGRIYPGTGGFRPTFSSQDRFNWQPVAGPGGAARTGLRAAGAKRGGSASQRYSSTLTLHVRASGEPAQLVRSCGHSLPIWTPAFRCWPWERSRIAPASRSRTSDSPPRSSRCVAPCHFSWPRSDSTRLLLFPSPSVRRRSESGVRWVRNLKTFSIRSSVGGCGWSPPGSRWVWPVRLP